MAKIICKICGEKVKPSELEAHAQLHSSLEPDPAPKSIFGVR
jgi:hypothetical protein